jgi:hypothetical protein
MIQIALRDYVEDLYNVHYGKHNLYTPEERENNLGRYSLSGEKMT